MRREYSEKAILMNRRLCIFFVTILTGCATYLTEKWNLYDAGPFNFSKPLSLTTDDSKHGIDSYMRVFTNADMVLNFDYGAYSGFPLNNSERRAGYVSRVESIAGHNAQIISFDGDLHFPEHFNYNIIASFLGAGLTIQVACKTDSDYNDAVRIFRSVRFKKGEIKWQ